MSKFVLRIVVGHWELNKHLYSLEVLPDFEYCEVDERSLRIIDHYEDKDYKFLGQEKVRQCTN